MILLYFIAAFLFFVWWIRGSIWPGAFLAFCSCGMIIFVISLGSKCAINPGNFDLITCGIMPYVWILLIISMAPWTIRKIIQKNSISNKALNLGKKLDNENQSDDKKYVKNLSEIEQYEFNRDVANIYKENLNECGQDSSCILNCDFISKINVCFLLGICKGFLHDRPELPTDKESRAWIYVLFFPALPLDKNFEKYRQFITETRNDVENNTFPSLQLAIANGMGAWEYRDDIDFSKIGLSMTYSLIEADLSKQS